jgi:hypothetical protein
MMPDSYYNLVKYCIRQTLCLILTLSLTNKKVFIKLTPAFLPSFHVFQPSTFPPGESVIKNFSFSLMWQQKSWSVCYCQVFSGNNAALCE